MLNGFILEDRTHEAETLFKKLIKYKFCEPDIVTYNTMINGLCKIGNNYTAISLLRLMDGRGCTPNNVSYNTIIHGLCNDLIIDDAFKLFKEMVSYKIIPCNVDTYNSLIYAFSNLSHWDEVLGMLNKMKYESISPNVKTFNILVDALCKQGKVKEAQLVSDIMVRSDSYPPDIATYNSLLNGYYLQDELTKAKTVFDDMVFRGVKPNADTYNRLADWYCKHHMPHEITDIYIAKAVVPKDNSVALYILSRVGFFLRDRLNNQATCKPIDEMQSQVEISNENDYEIILQTHVNRYEVEDALALFHFMNVSKLNLNSKVYNILIDGASKCGYFDTARRLFHDLFVKGLQPDIETYRVMIYGFCVRGLLQDAKQLFLKMEKSECLPTSVIINDLIQGYSENKTSDDVAMLLLELERKGYRKMKRMSLEESINNTPDPTDENDDFLEVIWRLDRKYENGGDF